MPDFEITPVLHAFRRAREAVVEHTDAMAAAGTSWHEETITDLLLSRVVPEARWAAFNRGQETELGADWLWWWVDPSGVSFGMLVQAKNLTFTKTGFPRVVFRHNRGPQLYRLLETADELDVPAAYGVYLGGMGYRHGWPCDQPPGCRDCLQRAVSIVPALTFTGGVTPTAAAQRTLDFGLPLEGLAEGVGPAPVMVMPGIELSPELRQFLEVPQRGAAAIAQAVFERVSIQRLSQYSHAHQNPLYSMIDVRAEGVTSAPMFQELPEDEDHSGNAYFDHVLRGLRRIPPGYVLDVLNDVQPTGPVTGVVAGIVVVPFGAEN